MFHALILRIGAGWLIETLACPVRLEKDPVSVQFKLMAVENIVQEDSRFPESDRNMKCHCHSGDDQRTLIHQIDELRERKVPKVCCACSRGEFLVLRMLLFTSEKDHGQSLLLELFCKSNPIPVVP